MIPSPRMKTLITPEWIHAHTPALIPIRRHLLVQFTETTTIQLHINMPRQSVIIVRTDKGHEVISDTARCVCLARSEYEAHLFLIKYADNYKLTNPTSKVGKKILEQINHSQEEFRQASSLR